MKDFETNLLFSRYIFLPISGQNLLSGQNNNNRGQFSPGGGLRPNLNNFRGPLLRPNQGAGGLRGGQRGVGGVAPLGGVLPPGGGGGILPPGGGLPPGAGGGGRFQGQPIVISRKKDQFRLKSLFLLHT